MLYIYFYLLYTFLQYLQYISHFSFFQINCSKSVNLLKHINPRVLHVLPTEFVACKYVNFAKNKFERLTSVKPKTNQRKTQRAVRKLII